jgi:hypothetical protein
MMDAGGGFACTILPDGTELFHMSIRGPPNTQLIAVPRANVHIVDSCLAQRQDRNMGVLIQPVGALLLNGGYSLNTDQRTQTEIISGLVDGYQITARIPPALPLPGRWLRSAF